MYDVISDQLLKLLHTAVRKASTPTKLATIDEVAEALSDLVKEDNLRHVIKFIDDNPPLMQLFKKDFVTRTLQLSSMKDKSLEMAVELLDGLCGANGNKIDLQRLYLVKHFDEAKMTFLNVCLRPLLGLDDPPRLKDMLPERDQLGQKMNTPKDADGFILQLTVKVLWERLESITQGKSNDPVEMFSNWTHVFCALRARLKCRRTVSSLLASNELYWFDLQMCIFLYSLDFALSPETVFKGLTGPQLKDVWKAAFQKKVHKDTYIGLEGVLPFVTCLFTTANNGTTPIQGLSFIQDILRYFLHDDEGPSTQDASLVAKFHTDAITFLSLCNDTLNMPGFQDKWEVLWKSVPFTWRTWMLHDMVHGKNAAWCTLVQTAAADLIYDFVKTENYSYTPRLLEQGFLPPIANPKCALEDSLFYVMLEAKSANKLDLLTLCKECYLITRMLDDVCCLAYNELSLRH
jgi:hypothetical protein